VGAGVIRQNDAGALGFVIEISAQKAKRSRCAISTTRSTPPKPCGGSRALPIRRPSAGGQYLLRRLGRRERRRRALAEKVQRIAVVVGDAVKVAIEKAGSIVHMVVRTVAHAVMV